MSATALPAAPLRALDPGALRGALDTEGFACLPGLLQPDACEELRALYVEEAAFRKRVVMARHGFGQGEYKYFARPLPPRVVSLRRDLYPTLVPIANDWNERMGREVRYPDGHDAFLEECKRVGQSEPTPLLLRYAEGDYNCLHQDLYGDLFFPLQVAVLLSEPGEEFHGGEFVLTEQRPRMQSRPYVVPLAKGDAVVFAVEKRPVRGARGFYRVNVRHGVSPLRGGERYTLGLIFHDATS